MVDLLAKLLKLCLVAGICGLVVVLCINEVSARGLLKPNPLEKLGLAQATWQNTLWQLSHLSSHWSQSTQKGAQLSAIWQQTLPQLNTLKDHGLAAAGVAQTFVKTQVVSAQPTAPASNSTESATGSSGPSPTLAPLEQRALDYTRYLYCQAAVKDYEQQHPELKAK